MHTHPLGVRGQVIFEEPYDACADVFSFGIVIAELLCRQIPVGMG